MTLYAQIEAAGFLLLSILLSALIGLERERNDKDAGLRTHILVGMGACLFTVLSYQAFPSGDPTRMAANVLTGIGFLGAGIIFQGQHRAHRLTTAAGIWSTAAVGVAVGTKNWLLAICATLLIWFVLSILNRLSLSDDAATD